MFKSSLNGDFLQTAYSCQSESHVTTDGQSVLVSSTRQGLRPDFYYCQTVAGLLMWCAVSDEKTCLSFTIAASPRQRSHFWVWVPRDSWPHFIDSPPPTWRARSPYLYPPRTGWPSYYAPGTGFPFRHLWLAGSRWRFPNPPPRWNS
jgi:hypothetical protein